MAFTEVIGQGMNAEKLKSNPPAEPQLRKAKAIIMDLRRNGGGSTEMEPYLATLIDKPVMLQREESREWVATYRAQGQAAPTLRFPAGSLSPILRTILQARSSC